MYNDSSLSLYEKDNNTVFITMPPLVYKTVQSSVTSSNDNNCTTLCSSSEDLNFDFMTEIMRNITASENVKNFIVTLPTKVMNLDVINTTVDVDSTMEIIGNVSDVKIEIDKRKVEVNSVIHYGVISIVILSLLYIFFLSYYLRRRFCKANNWRRRRDVTFC